MINFRYHIVSLMAVFLALSVGIAVGVSLGPSVDQGALRDVRVAVVSMPDAPDRVVSDVTAAVASAGGAVVREVEIRPEAFDPARSDALTEALAGLADQVPLTEEMTQAEKVGSALARS